MEARNMIKNTAGRIAIALVALALSAGAARAQDPQPNMPTATATVTPPAVDVLSKEGWSTKIVDRPIALSAGMLEADVPFIASLTKDATGKPVNIPLAIYYGVTNEFQLSLHHATGLCVTGTSNGCAKAYNDLGLRGTYSILGRGSSFELAAWAQLQAATFSPDLVMQAYVGPYFNWVISPQLLLLTNPGLVLGLNKRDAGNKEQVSIPVNFYVQASDHLAPYLFTGMFGYFEKFSDNFAVPVGVGAFYSLNNRVDLIAEFDFLNLVGSSPPMGASRTDRRQLMIQVNVRPL
jgi:hypothetical protein